MSKRKCQTRSMKTCVSKDSVIDAGVHKLNDVREFRKSVLEWYDHNKRDLPWRKMKDPNKRAYGVWVSEIMLQQTQVATVIDYYNKWMKKWPTVEALSKASLDEVNEQWSGLGYYSRGRRLHEGALKVMNELGGNIPTSAESLIKELPGVGRYTAGAIASIAFGEVTGLVDGNVSRVFSRLCMIGADMTSQPAVDAFWNLANSTVDEKRPGDFNQSLMELGATVCTPKNANCSKCPVQKSCKAYSQVEIQKSQSKLVDNKDTKSAMKLKDIECLIEDCKLCFGNDENWDSSLGVMNYPRKGRKKAPREEKTAVCVLQRQTSDGTEYFMVQRPETGLLANLWEFPSVAVDLDSSPTQCQHKMDDFLTQEFGLDSHHFKERKVKGEVFHLFSHIHQTYMVESLVIDTDVDLTQQTRRCKWISRQDFDQAAVSTAMKKVMKLQDNVSVRAKSKKQSPKNDGLKQLSMSSFFKPKQK